MTHPTKRFITVRETADIYGFSRSTIYELIGGGHFQAVKSGARTLIIVQSVEDYMASLPAAKVAAPRARAA